MDAHLTPASARSHVAQACLDALPEARLGEILLRDSQRFMIARANRALRRDGGCLIAEEVGRGKTYIALALARRFQSVLVVAPAALRDTWSLAMKNVRCTAALVSHEALSRGNDPIQGHDVVIVDESHHFRNPATRRYHALAELTATVPVILLSATPFQNRSGDLAAQVALFHGDGADELSDVQLARFALRSHPDPDGTLPRVAAPEWLVVHADDGAVLDAILNLASPPRAVDAGDSGALRILSLARSWASSRAALAATLRTRRRTVTAIEQCMEAGRIPTRAELRSWSQIGSDIQLGFAGLLADANSRPECASELRELVAAELLSLDQLADLLGSTADPDIARAERLRDLMLEFPGTRILAFSEFAHTIERMFGLLRNSSRVGMSTARTCRIASGRLPRSELLRLFSPKAQGVSEPPSHQVVTMLLTTDLLAEGVNLQDAGIVVHLDLPWNPGRLTQRLGRIRRPGGVHTVRSFLFTPPAESAQLVRAESILRRKALEAEAALGKGLDVVPRLGAHGAVTLDVSASARIGVAELEGMLFERLRQWRNPESGRTSTGVAHVVPESASTGWLAALNDGCLIASLRGMTSEDPHHVMEAVNVIDHAGARLSTSSQAPDELTAYLEQRELTSVCGADTNDSRLQGHLAALLQKVHQKVGRHERSSVARAISELRQFIARPAPIGLQRRIEDILGDESVGCPVEKLQRAHAICGLNCQALRTPAAVVAIIAFTYAA